MKTAWRFLTIVLAGLLQGLSFAHLVELPAKLQFDGQLYAALQRALYSLSGPANFGGWLEPATIMATLVLAYLVRRNVVERGLTIGAGIALLLSFGVVFVWLVAPSSAAFSASPDVVPANWSDLRTQWELGNGIRFLLQFAAFAMLVGGGLVHRRSVESSVFNTPVERPLAAPGHPAVLATGALRRSA